MRIFVSAGEPSGDLHGANLIQSLRRLRPDLAFDGFGGERMSDAGCSLVYPLCDLAMIGFFRVAANVHRFAAVLARAERHFRTHRPDAVVLIDFPGFHWWLARSARAAGIPVLYFVPPQMWGWAGWRARKMRRLVNRVLCALPFEEPWYRRRHIPVTYVGHPYFDQLHRQRLDAGFLREQQSRPGPVVAVLPGSRRQELENNTDLLLHAAGLVRARRPDVRFVAACLREQHRDAVAARAAELGLPLEAYAGRTPEIIHLAHSCLAVSGSVSLEMLFAAKPAVIAYKVHRFGMLLCHLLKQCRYITLVNLLADRELYPEFLTTGFPAQAMAGQVLHWLEDSPAYEALRAELWDLRNHVAEPGASDRAAAAVLEFVEQRATRSSRAA
jgi:lipid-A-disaccharide synthase